MGIKRIYRAAATARFSLGIAMVPALTGAQIVVRGTLYNDATGLPVHGTVMLVDPSTDAAVVHVATDSLGQFALQSGNGTYQIAAVCAGYTSVLSAAIPLVNGEQMTVRVPIAESGDPQHRITVVQHVRPAASAAFAAAQGESDVPGFERRRAVGVGLRYDRAEIAKANVATLGEFLESVPGFSVRDPSSTSSMQMTRNAGLMSAGSIGPLAQSCHVGWFVDGHRMDLRSGIDPATDALGSMQLEAIEAIEIFRGVSEMPPELADPDLRCGAVSIWTRRG